MSSENEQILAKLRALVEKNYPQLRDRLPSEDQVYMLKTNEGLSLVVRLSKAGISVEQGEYPNPISTMSMSAADLKLLLDGELDGVKAFLSGRVRVQGDVFKTMSLNSLLKGD
jgi:putative sterol carrier protein